MTAEYHIAKRIGVQAVAYPHKDDAPKVIERIQRIYEDNRWTMPNCLHDPEAWEGDEEITIWDNHPVVKKEKAQAWKTTATPGSVIIITDEQRCFAVSEDVFAAFWRPMREPE